MAQTEDVWSQLDAAWHNVHELWTASVQALEVPDVCASDDSERIGWYISPEQHLLEFVVFNVLGFVALVLALPYVKRASLHPKHENQRFEERPPTKLSRTIDLSIAVCLTLSFVTVVVHKWLKGNLYFLLQPCHVIHFLSIVLAILPDTGRRWRTIGHSLFNMLLCFYFAPILGLLFADLSCYKLPFELANWAIQHALLVLLPFFWLATRRFALVVSPSFFFYTWVIIFLYHMFLLTPAGLLTGSNINFTICPPGVMSPAGRWFRWITPVVMLGLVMFCRGGILGLYCRICGIPQNTGVVDGYLVVRARSNSFMESRKGQQPPSAKVKKQD